MAFQGEYFVERYGSAAGANAPPITSMLGGTGRTFGTDPELPVGAGTDGTRVATYNPFVSLEWLSTQETVGGVDLGRDAPAAHRSNRVSRAQALHLWTAANAWFTRDEGRLGQLLVGQIADLAVLREDYFAPTTRVRDLESALTVVDGNIVYAEASAFPSQAARLPQIQIEPSWSPVARFGGYQIAGSTAWARQADPSTPSAAAVAESTDSVATNPTAGSQTTFDPIIRPATFFEHGHDC